MIMNYKGFVPDVNNAAFVADNACVIGRVQMGQGSSAWFGAVLRGDDEKIIIGKNSNIQDNCTVHCTPGFPAVIGDDVSVGNNAVLHGTARSSAKTALWAPVRLLRKISISPIIRL